MRFNLKNVRSIAPTMVIVGVILASVAGLGYLLRDFPWETIRQASLAFLGAVLGVTMTLTALYTLLVYVLIRGSGYSVTLPRAYLMLTASLSANYMTPVKAGIPLRIFLYGHFLDMPPATGTALVAVEALIGMLTPALVSVIGVRLFFPSIGLGAPIALSLILVLGLVVAVRLPAGAIERWTGRSRAARLMRRVGHFIADVQTGLRSLPIAILGAVVLLQLTMLALQAVRMWLVLRILGLSLPVLGLVAAFAASLTAGNLSMIPMGLGVRDASLIVLLTSLGAPHEIAISAALVQRLFAPGWPLLLGVISSNILGLSELRRRSGAGEAAESRAPAPTQSGPAEE